MHQNPTQLLNGEASLLIDGPAGDLELLTLQANDAKGVGIICHPHPLYAGTMHNKVVHTLSRAFHQKGLHAIRFNFRGVGKSAGVFGNSVGETADLMAVLAWVDMVLPQSRIWLAGFSFGAYIAAVGASNHECEQLFSIAPGVNHQPYEQLPDIRCPWTVIQPENDEVIPPNEVYQWFEQAKNHALMTLIKVPECTHYFHGKLIALRTLIEQAIIV